MSISGDFCELLDQECGRVAEELGGDDVEIDQLRTVQKECRKVLKELQKAVILSGFSGGGYQYSNGVSVFFPWSRETYEASRKNYESLWFAQDAKLEGLSWTNFLKKYLYDVSLRKLTMPADNAPAGSKYRYPSGVKFDERFGSVLSDGNGASKTKVGGQERTKIAGQEGTKIAGQEGTKIAGQEGTKIAGQEGTKIAGQEGTKIAGQEGTKIAGQEGTKIAGQEGTKIAGQEGTKIAGQEGTKIAGQEGTKIAGQEGPRSRVRKAPRSLVRKAPRSRVRKDQDCGSGRNQDRGSGRHQDRGSGRNQRSLVRKVRNWVAGDRVRSSTAYDSSKISRAVGTFLGLRRNLARSILPTSVAFAIVPTFERIKYVSLSCDLSVLRLCGERFVAIDRAALRFTQRLRVIPPDQERKELPAHFLPCRNRRHTFKWRRL